MRVKGACGSEVEKNSDQKLLIADDTLDRISFSYDFRFIERFSEDSLNISSYLRFSLEIS